MKKKFHASPLSHLDISGSALHCKMHFISYFGVRRVRAEVREIENDENMVKARSTPSVLKNETTGCLRRKHNERKAMAQREALRKRIVEHLRHSNDGTSSLKEIVQNLGADKKCINQILYALKRANAVSQVSYVPPVWKLRDYGLAIRAPVWSQNSKLKYRPTSPKKNISRNKVIFCIYIYL